MPLQFSEATLAEYRDLLGRYPERQAALLPTLWLAQREFGWLSEEAIAYVAELMELPAARVAGVASFYTMYNKKPVGRYHIQVCRTLSCALRGAADITASIERHLGIRVGETTPDGLFTLSEVECLASCGTAPMLQLNDDYVENLSVESTLALLDQLKGNDVG
jgi:NADH-quinone oxidoreductase E subunit